MSSPIRTESSKGPSCHGRLARAGAAIRGYGRLIALAAPLLLLAAAPTTAPTTAPASSAGRLLIMGGNIGRHSDEIYAHLIANTPDAGTIGIIPTASGIADESSAASLKKLRGYAKPGQSVVLVPLKMNDGPKADDPEVAKLIESCGALFFLGGDQSRILDVFRPRGRRTKASDAIDAVLAKGGIVSGSSAGAAIMSDPMISGGSSASAFKPPRPGTRPASPAVPLVPGMGYFSYGLVDQHFLQRGRLGRLVIAMESTQSQFGFGIPEDRAILVNRATGVVEVVGNQGLVLLDRRTATLLPTREGVDRNDWRLSLLSSGDRFDANTGGITIAAERRPFVTKRKGLVEIRRDPWASNQISVMVQKLALGNGEEIWARDDDTNVMLTADEHSEFYGDPKNPKTMTVIGLRLSITPSY